MSLWYAVRTATRREKYALKALTEQGFAVFMPCETWIRQTSRVREIATGPLFPGYMFVLCDGEDETFHQVRGIDGVHAFVTCSTGEGGVAVPIPFPTHVIIGLQAEERAGLFDRTRKVKVPYKPKKGDRVKVTAGVYQGFIARVLATPRGERAHVMVQVFGRESGKTVDVEHLTAA